MQNLKLFEDKSVRTIWDEEHEKWYFSVVDVVAVLTESPDAKRYWSVLKSRLKKESGQSTTICSTLKLQAADGKMRLTDVADTEGILRIIQAIPSPKAEPFKVWLAQVGASRDRPHGALDKRCKVSAEDKLAWTMPSRRPSARHSLKLGAAPRAGRVQKARTLGKHIPRNHEYKPKLY